MEIREESLSSLEEYARVPIAFEVSRVLELTLRDGGSGGFELVERPVTPTFVKDYDAIPGNRPLDWARRLDLSSWGLLSARLAGECVGGAAIALNTPGLHMSMIAAILRSSGTFVCRAMPVGEALALRCSLRLGNGPRGEVVAGSKSKPRTSTFQRAGFT